MTEVYSAANVMPNSINPYISVFIISKKHIGSGNELLCSKCVVIFPGQSKTEMLWRIEVFTCVLCD